MDSTKTTDAKATTAKAPKADKAPKAKKAAPEYKTLTVKFNKTEKTYEAYDKNGNIYVEADCPRQIMMHLAYKAGQVLYFRGKKWRRAKVAAQVVVTQIPDSTVVATPAV